MANLPIRRNASAANLLEQQLLFSPQQQVQGAGKIATLDRHDQRYTPRENSSHNYPANNNAQGNFLELGLPTPIYREGTVGGRLSDLRSMTLPGRTRNNYDNSDCASLQHMVEGEGTQRMRHSKSGLPPEIASSGLPNTAATDGLYAPTTAVNAANVSSPLPRDARPVRQAITGSKSADNHVCQA